MTFDLRLADVYSLAPAAWLCLFVDNTSCVVDRGEVIPNAGGVLPVHFWLGLLEVVAPPWVYRMARHTLRRDYSRAC